MNKKIGATALTLGVAAAVLLTGTYAYQSLNQEVTNEASGIVNPGGRLHDDFNYDEDVKRIYVENFGDQNIYARVKLSEYFEIGAGSGKDWNSETRNVEVITVDADYNDKTTWQMHYFDQENVTDEYWTYDLGGEAYKYMPTFNMNKDSLEVDINGTYDPNGDGDITDRYSDYIDYSLESNATKSDYEIYDADTNTIDEFLDGSEVLGTTYTQSESEVTHSVRETKAACVISLTEWATKTDAEKETTECWVYDTDGWAYWSQPIGSGTATGTLVNDIDIKNVDENWFYAVSATAQFITADDLGRNDGTGFYDLEKGTEPTTEALELLEFIGVDTEETVQSTYEMVILPNENGETFDGYFSSGDEWTLQLNKDGEPLENVTWSMELIDGGDDENDNTLEGSTIDENTGVITIVDGETSYTSNGYDASVYHMIKITASIDDIVISKEFIIIDNLIVEYMNFYENDTYINHASSSIYHVSQLKTNVTYDVVPVLWDQNTYSNKYTDLVGDIILDDIITVKDEDGNVVDSSVYTFENNEITFYSSGIYRIEAVGTVDYWEINIARLDEVVDEN